MNRLLYIALVVSLLSADLFSQSYFIRGKVLDYDTKQPIYNAHIKIKGTESGTVSDENGRFYLLSEKSIIAIEISHVAYEKKKMQVDFQQNQELQIVLKKHIDTLPEATVIAHAIENLVERMLYDVVDYEILGDSILLLTYSWKEQQNPWLIIMNQKGDHVYKQLAIKEGSLYKDCMGNIHLVSKDKAYQLFVDSNRLYFLYPIEVDSFKKILNPCVASINQKFYIQQYSYHNQVLSYYLATEHNAAKTIRVISDKVALRMLADRNRFYNMGARGVTEFDIRFEEMCFFDPIFAPMLKLRDSLVILNFVEDSIELYELKGKLIRKTAMSFHKKKGWKEEIFSDEITGKIYAVYRKDGLTKVAEINLLHGTLGEEISIPRFKYIEKIKAYNGNLYFLYRANKPNELTNLYKMKL